MVKFETCTAFSFDCKRTLRQTLSKILENNKYLGNSYIEFFGLSVEGFLIVAIKTEIIKWFVSNSVQLSR